jgi:5-methylcytosine-specific restriction endonuclease McrA
MKREEMRRLRKAKQESLIQNGCEPGWQVCTKCYRKKRSSEYQALREDGTTKLRKLCDSCLTRLYSHKSRNGEGMDAIFWRKKAYTCNNAFRQCVAGRMGVPVSQVKLSDLQHVCKPQDLIQKYNEQDGKCAFCSTTLTVIDLSIDHDSPRSRGGENAIENILIACLDCNRMKWNRTGVEFRAFLKEYVSRFQVSEPEDKEPQG